MLSGIYRGDSVACTAARHAGIIKDRGGIFKVQMHGVQNHFGGMDNMLCQFR